MIAATLGEKLNKSTGVREDVQEETIMKQMILISAVCAVLSGCYSVTTKLAPTNPQVPVQLYGSDCTSMILGISVGENSADVAIANGISYDLGVGKKTIRSIHSIALSDDYFMGFGSRCIIVKGAP